MNNLKLRKKLQKINHTCGDCGGYGTVEVIEESIGLGSYPDVDDCNTCSFTGIDIPLEFGCEILHKDEDYGERLYTVLELQKKGFFTQYTGFDGTYKLFKSFRFDDSMGKWQNLGKESTEGDLLRALRFEYVIDKTGTIYEIKDSNKLGLVSLTKIVRLDLSKTVETQTQEVTNQLIEILS
jgi:hypothetical protein